MDTLERVLEIYNIDLAQYRHLPIEIPNMGREQLADLFSILNFRTGAEVGTEQGKYAEVLCKANPTGHLYCIDAWEDYDFYRDYKGKQEKLSAYHQIWRERMGKYHATEINAYSMDAVGKFPDGSLDFVYIDANHELPFVVQDIFYWSRKVRAGGIIAGHDYYETKSVNSRCHVVPAVIAYTRAFWVNPWFICGTKAIRPGEIRERSRSWFWVKDERQP